VNSPPAFADAAGAGAMNSPPAFAAAAGAGAVNSPSAFADAAGGPAALLMTVPCALDALAAGAELGGEGAHENPAKASVLCSQNELGQILADHLY
jgi:hypothetical protein